VSPHIFILSRDEAGWRVASQFAGFFSALQSRPKPESAFPIKSAGICQNVTRLPRVLGGIMRD
jgi:hypothetical protein